MEISPLTPDRLRASVAILTRAFWDYPEAVYLSRASERRRRRMLPAYMADDCRGSMAGGGALVAVDDGTVVGAALYMPPSAYPVPLRQELGQALRLAPTLPWTAPVLPEILRNRTAQRAGHPKIPHYYVKVLGVDPRAQSTGVGSALLSEVLGKADAEGLGCYLTTNTPGNVSWYARFGFNVTEEFNPTPRWPRVWRLWRETDTPA